MSRGGGTGVGSGVGPASARAWAPASARGSGPGRARAAARVGAGARPRRLGRLGGDLGRGGRRGGGAASTRRPPADADSRPVAHDPAAQAPRAHAEPARRAAHAHPADRPWPLAGRRGMAVSRGLVGRGVVVAADLLASRSRDRLGLAPAIGAGAGRGGRCPRDGGGRGGLRRVVLGHGVDGRDAAGHAGAGDGDDDRELRHDDRRAAARRRHGAAAGAAQHGDLQAHARRHRQEDRQAGALSDDGDAVRRARLAVAQVTPQRARFAGRPRARSRADRGSSRTAAHAPRARRSARCAPGRRAP